MPLQRACDAVNQGGTADKKFYSSLTESIFLSGTFFMQWKHSLVQRMKIMLDLTEVKKIASEANYNVLPVSLEMLSDFTTPIETMRILKNVSTHCYMLESAQANETWGRYTFLGFDPKLEITCINGETKSGNLWC